MRLLVVASSLLAFLAACGVGGTETPPDDEREELLTGAGGGPTSTASSAASGTAASTTTGGGASTSSSVGSGGAGGEPPACPDLGVGEPNETESNAFELKATAISDCDGDGGNVSGTIAGASDVDWFTYEGDDQFGCEVDPTRSLTQSEAGLRLCKFFECFSGDTEVTCPSEATAATSPEGRAGCCHDSGFEMPFDGLNCTGTTDEHVKVYIRIDQPGATAATCNAYTVSYHY